MKTCPGCKSTISINEFRVRKNGKLYSRCRACERAYQQDINNRHREKIRERKRLSMAKRRVEDPDKVRAAARKYHHNNRDKQNLKMRTFYHRRFFWSRAMKLKGLNRATTRDLAVLWKKQKGRCALTGRRLDRSAHLDHILPRARGGDDAVGNVRWVCPEVNLVKRDLLDAELLSLCVDVMRWIGARMDAQLKIIKQMESKSA